MLIRILRSTVAVPVGNGPQAVDPGQVIEVDAMQGAQLIALRKAVAVDSSPVGGMIQTPEDALIPVEIRSGVKSPRKGKR